MQKKRLIFNLDGTLLTGEAHLTENFYKDRFGEKAYPFILEISENLDRFERIFEQYSYEELAKFLSARSGLSISTRFVREWSDAISEGHDMLDDDAVETLTYLKKKKFSLAVLTNWFGECQIRRLKRAGLLDYFDDIYPGDYVLKPHKEAYLKAKGDFDYDECVFIGNSLERDYIAPRAFGMEGILLDRDNQQHETVAKVKTLGELKGNRRIYGK